jgi:hypothetical protein
MPANADANAEKTQREREQSEPETEGSIFQADRLTKANSTCLTFNPKPPASQNAWCKRFRGMPSPKFSSNRWPPVCDNLEAMVSWVAKGHRQMSAKFALYSDLGESEQDRIALAVMSFPVRSLSQQAG